MKYYDHDYLKEIINNGKHIHYKFVGSNRGCRPVRNEGGRGLMYSAILTIHVEIKPEIWQKYELYYPDKESIADEILRQIGESGALITGKSLILKFRPYKGGRGQ